MKINKILLASSLLVILPTSFAQEHSNSTSSYLELHNAGIAESSYNDFKNGSGEDPFLYLKNGYKGRYSREMADFVVGEKDRMVSDFLSDKENDIALSIRQLSDSEASSLASIYESHIGDDGTFDSEGYAEAYESHMESKRLARDSSMSMHYESLLGTMDEGVELQNGYKSSLGRDVSSAQQNLINILDTRKDSRRTALRDIHDNALGRVGGLSELASETLLLANEYTDCGDTCDFVEPPPPIDPEVICKGDENHQFAYGQARGATRGTWIYNGQQIHYDNVNGLGTTTVIYDGKTLFRGNMYWNGSAVDLYELCYEE